MADAGGKASLFESSGRGAAARGLRLSFEDDRDRRRKADTASQPDTAEAPKAKKKRGSSPEVGHALRAAYQQAVSEDIPPEMLDLLGKLG
jgi:Anti-sigma factor NepR